MYIYEYVIVLSASDVMVWSEVMCSIVLSCIIDDGFPFRECVDII